MSATVLQGSVFDVLPTIAPGSVDCCVTSPPYWMLRSYLPKGHALKPLELGSEKTPREFIENMVKVFRLVRECLADHGTCWVNMGDTYAASGNGIELESGNICLIPQRLAIALQDDGWIVRSVIVWHKPAPMPSSVRGWEWRRCRVKVKPGWGPHGTAAHPGTMNGGSARVPNSGGKKTAGVAEWSNCPGCPKCEPNGGYVLRRGSWRPTSSWEPILMLAKSGKYYCDGEAVKQPAATATVQRDQYTRILDDPEEQFALKHDHETICDGANLRDVWTIAAERLNEAHYAAFPTELVSRCLRAGTAYKGYCVKCGGPVTRMIEDGQKPPIECYSRRNAPTDEQVFSGTRVNGVMRGSGQKVQNWLNEHPAKTLGFRASCKCNAPTRPGLVLDPFCGSGRVGITCQRLGLDFIGVELNPAYVEMSKRILYEANPLFEDTA